MTGKVNDVEKILFAGERKRKLVEYINDSAAGDRGCSIKITQMKLD